MNIHIYNSHLSVYNRVLLVVCENNSIAFENNIIIYRIGIKCNDTFSPHREVIYKK